MRYFIAIFIITCLFSPGKAQQTALHSQYMLNEFMLNPATAGSNGMTSINLSGRKQWLGWENAPETYSVSASSRLLKSTSPFINKRKPGPGSIKKGPIGRIGLGAYVLKDKNGAIDRTSVNFTYAYHIPLYMSQLSLGINVVGYQYSIDPELAQLEDDGDPLESNIGVQTFSPDAIFGVDYSNRKFHVGLAVHNVLQTPLKIGNEFANLSELSQERQYFFLANFRNPINSSKVWYYEPGITARFTENFGNSAEASLRIIFNEQYWFGVSYRTSKDLIAILGLKYDRYYFGYSFDYGFSEISKLAYGSHEVNLAIKLGDNDRRFPFWERY